MALQHRTQFRTVTWREGSRGRLRSRFWARRVQTAWHWQLGAAPGSGVWLLVEWPQDKAEPTKYYLCDLPEALSLKKLVDTARGRWRVEMG